SNQTKYSIELNQNESYPEESQDEPCSDEPCPDELSSQAE
ncbi:6369_t:CDS:1, partial [Cetraspora pellucida]